MNRFLWRLSVLLFVPICIAMFVTCIFWMPVVGFVSWVATGNGENLIDLVIGWLDKWAEKIDPTYDRQCNKKQ